jgi:predicted enzyme related to lactoylglutathione lyase
MSEKQSYAHGEFCWVDLMAVDVQRAAAFYGEIFGWSCDDKDVQDGPFYGHFTLNGKTVAGLGQLPDEMRSQGVPPHWNSYINVDDVHATADRLVELGGTLLMPPTPIFDAGTMAIAQDPTGAAISLWQKGRTIGAELANEIGCFCWNELATRDIERSREFYGALLGWDFVDHPTPNHRYYVIKNQGRENGGLIEMGKDWGDAPAHWMVYFTVADADETVQQVQRAGGQSCVPPFDVPDYGRIAVLSDNEGAVFSVIKLLLPPE